MKISTENLQQLRAEALKACITGNMAMVWARAAMGNWTQINYFEPTPEQFDQFFKDCIELEGKIKAYGFYFRVQENAPNSEEE